MAEHGAYPIAVGINQNGQQPRLGVRPGLHMMQRPEGFEAGLLHQILCIRRLTDEAANKAPHGGQVRLHECRKDLTPVFALGHICAVTEGCQSYREERASWHIIPARLKNKGRAATCLPGRKTLSCARYPILREGRPERTVMSLLPESWPQDGNSRCFFLVP